MRYLKILLFTVAFMCFAQVTFADVSVYIDDKEITFTDVSPMIINSRTYVPMRKIFEELGACVDWVGETRTVFASKRFQNISLTIDDSEYYVNGTAYPLENPALIINSRTMVPVKVIAESLGAKVVWNGDNSRVLIYINDGEYDIADKYIDYWECADDGKVIMTGRTAYPQIKSEDSVAKAFNYFFLVEAEELNKNKVIKYKEYAVSGYNEYKENYIPYMLERSFDVTYNADGIISLLIADSDFSGGTHPSYEMYGVTYNMKNGNKIECDDILDEDTYTIRENVYKMFKELIEKEPDKYYFDAVECLEDALVDLKWYLDEEGVHFFLNPYEISPYATGVVEVVY